MKALFIHQNMPGQFRHLAPALARDDRNEVVFITRREDRELPGIRRIVYAPSRAPHRETHHYLHQCEDAVLHGQGVVRACLALRRDGFSPDLVVAHPGWGESLFVKDAWPAATLLNYGEFYYRPEGADVDFDPEFPSTFDERCKLRARSAHLLLALEAADRTLCPTEWQKSLHPATFHERIRVIFDGIDSDAVSPDPAARFTLPTGRVLSAGDEVVSYVSRSLEPCRGFHTLMRALPRLCALRPQAQIVIAGGDQRGYGPAAPDGKCWRETLLAESAIDPARVHFVGIVDYPRYLSLLRVSAAHVYLTVPFVLSWSMLEAMAAGCLVVGSRTPPVEEVIEPGVNGLLVDFLSPGELADTVALALAERPAFAALRRAARQTIVEDYSVKACLPRHLALVDELRGGAAIGRRRQAAPAAAAFSGLDA
ncbi:MAG TPA: glycosyltransferase family 4 protein [Stellaceae bacterium]|nr:glycosyltransferase family 4 protein [Stellaceae bacterium]